MSALLSRLVRLPSLRRNALITLALVALALLLVAGWHGASSARVSVLPSQLRPPHDPMRDPQREQINALLLAEQLPDVQIHAASNGKWLLTGWVPQATDLARLKRRLSPYPVSFAIGVSQEVARYLSEHLSELRIDAVVSAQQAGKFRVQCRGNDQTGFDQAIGRIVQNLPHAVHIDTHYEALGSVKPDPKPVPKIAAPVPVRHLLTGIDGIVSAPRSSYLTAGSHYVFSGGTLRDGAVVLSISTDRVEVTRAGDTTVVSPQLTGTKHEAEGRK